MKAMILNHIASLADNPAPLRMADISVPEPKPGEVLIRVSVCGVCHTELDEIEGRTPPPTLPMVLGHQVVGRVEALGSGVKGRSLGDRLGLAWIHSACGKCNHCQKGEENLCPEFKATGRDAFGGYAEYTTAPADFTFPIPETISDEKAAPLLCAGAIGYRSLRLTGLANGQSLGLTGFGASAHLVLKMVRQKYPDTEVFVFARNEKEREFALEIGAAWSGDTIDPSPIKLDAIIDTTPAWKPVTEALKNLAPGGRLVINAIRKEDRDKPELMNLNYENQLWMEKEIKSVANVARRDVLEFLQLAEEIPIRPEVRVFELADANRALMELKSGQIRGAKVLACS